MGGFLPVTAGELRDLGWDRPDFVYVVGDAYVDHPSFGHAVISRVLEKNGFRVAMLPQPDWRSCEDFKRFGEPRLGFLVTGGVIDSMVNHYTVAKRRRSEDAYAPGGKAGCRPDRAVIVYCNRIREAYGDIPILIGGLEASLRRFAHYDYWDDRVRNSILVDSGADLLMYGMGENIVVDAAKWLDYGRDIRISRIAGTCVMAKDVPEGYIEIPSVEEVARDKALYAKCFMMQYDEQDAVRGRGLAQGHQKGFLVQHPPAAPLSQEELDAVYALPYMRTWHPMYDGAGGVPALKEVEFSLTSARGCFGGCSFCAITMHQGRVVSARSEESLVREAEEFTKQKNFKGYIHDVGGPTANFRYPACEKQKACGTCRERQCLFPTPCRHLRADHGEYLALLNRLRAIKGVKKVFVRSGIRYDYLLLDRSDAFLNALVKNHVSGQLRVAPEHVSRRVLRYMGKPEIASFEAFAKKYDAACEKAGLNQYLVCYFMSSHPGSTLEDAAELALYLKKTGLHPEQVQDFYPTPGTLSTAMYYTGIDPRDGKKVYVPRDPREKAMQRALMQYFVPRNRPLVEEALRKAGRGDLIPVLLAGVRRTEKEASQNGGTRNSGRNLRPGQNRAPHDDGFSKGKGASRDGRRVKVSRKGKGGGGKV
ncbi:MAG: YgiQ family radical SAM protein [Christensenellales bacterium]|jgi:uncharacterized radical SAM protein YgiQ